MLYYDWNICHFLYENYFLVFRWLLVREVFRIKNGLSKNMFQNPITVFPIVTFLKTKHALRDLKILISMIFVVSPTPTSDVLL